MQTWDEFKAKPDAIIGVQGIAYDENSSYQRGPADAPPLIRAAFAASGSFVCVYFCARG